MPQTYLLYNLFNMKKIFLLMALLLPFTIDSYCKDNGGPVTHEEHEYVDLGLPSGTLWATCNVGANSPEEYGGHFAWGETETKESYYPRDYKWGEGLERMTKYITNFIVHYHRIPNIDHPYRGYVDNKIELDPEDDAATVNWGPQWCTPTKAQLDELQERCTWYKAIVNSVDGCLVRGSNGNAIFLPAAGKSCGKTWHGGPYGAYWSRMINPEEPFWAYLIVFDMRRNRIYKESTEFRSFGASVRAVRVSQD